MQQQDVDDSFVTLLKEASNGLVLKKKRSGRLWGKRICTCLAATIRAVIPVFSSYTFTSTYLSRRSSTRPVMVKKKKKGVSVGEFRGEMRHLYSRCRYRTPPEAPCPSWRIWRKEEASQRLQKKAVISPRVSSQINGGTLTLDEFLVL